MWKRCGVLLTGWVLATAFAVPAVGAGEITFGDTDHDLLQVHVVGSPATSDPGFLNAGHFIFVYLTYTNTQGAQTLPDVAAQLQMYRQERDANEDPFLKLLNKRPMSLYNLGGDCLAGGSPPCNHVINTRMDITVPGNGVATIARAVISPLRLIHAGTYVLAVHITSPVLADQPITGLGGSVLDGTYWTIVNIAN